MVNQVYIKNKMVKIRKLASGLALALSVVVSSSATAVSAQIPDCGDGMPCEFGCGGACGGANCCAPQQGCCNPAATDFTSGTVIKSSMKTASDQRLQEKDTMKPSGVAMAAPAPTNFLSRAMKKAFGEDQQCSWCKADEICCNGAYVDSCCPPGTNCHSNGGCFDESTGKQTDATSAWFQMKAVALDRHVEHNQEKEKNKDVKPCSKAGSTACGLVDPKGECCSEDKMGFPNCCIGTDCCDKVKANYKEVKNGSNSKSEISGLKVAEELVSNAFSGHTPPL